VGFTDGLLHLGDHRLFPRLHADGASIEQRQLRHLAQRHRRAVVVDVDLVQHARMGAAGADLLQFGLERLDGAAHLGLGGLLDVGSTHDLSSLLTDARAPQAGAVLGTEGLQTCTSVPSSSPSTTRLSAPGLKMLKTLMGRFWSRHSANAVASITCRFLPMASSNVIDV